MTYPPTYLGSGDLARHGRDYSVVAGQSGRRRHREGVFIEGAAQGAEEA